MEDSFKVRVDKVFGALGSHSVPSVAVTSSLWSLTDEEIERRQWNRNKQEEADEGGDSGPSVLREQLEPDLKDLSGNEVEEEEEEEDEEEEDEETDGEKEKRRRSNSSSAEAGADDDDDDYLDVQSSIGKDPTLDYEEEEDKYDKVAVGMEQTGDRLYMRDVRSVEYGIHELNEFGEIPNTFQDAIRDPRANHTAAKIRLKEDAEAAGEFDTLQLSDDSISMNAEPENPKISESEGDNNPKPILKKRESPPDSKSQKRVRFMCDPKSSSQTHEDQLPSGAGDVASEPQARSDSAMSEQTSDLSHYSSGVADYLRNPSKYTKYTFDDSDDLDEQSNRNAYIDFFRYVRERNTNSSPDATSAEVPKSIVFTPKRKPEDDSMMKRSESEHRTGDNSKNKILPVGITAEESEISAMEEDEPSMAVDEGRSSHKPGQRQYRTRTNIDVEDNIN